MTETDLPNLAVRLDEVKRAPVRLALALSKEERGVLAAMHTLEEVKIFRLTATAETVKRRKMRVEGTITAEVTYRCGVTLKPYDAAVHVPFTQLFGDDGGPGDASQRVAAQNPGQPREIEIDPFDDDELEPLTGGVADIADLAYQLFAIALDPYPRHPDLAPPADDRVKAVLAADDEPQAASPFAVLKQLKD